MSLQELQSEYYNLMANRWSGGGGGDAAPLEMLQSAVSLVFGAGEG